MCPRIIVEETKLETEDTLERLIDCKDITNTEEVVINKIRCDKIPIHPPLPIQSSKIAIAPIQKMTILECLQEISANKTQHDGDIKQGQEGVKKESHTIKSVSEPKRRGPILNSVTQFLDISMIYR